MPPSDQGHRHPEDLQRTLEPTPGASTPPEQQEAATLPAAPPPLEQTQAALEQLRPGQMLGQYRIEEQLGAGGMGLVFKAVHAAMQRTVALKVIAPQLTQDPQTRARFQREVRSAARLSHPNVVVAHDAAEAGGLWFLAMEYVPGTDAAHLCQRHGRPPVALACEIARQAALGLQHAHELGMVHRDIKPANLIVTVASQTGSWSAGPPAGWPNPPLVKILDFGLARLAPGGEEAVLNAASDVTRQGSVLGTPSYMAPEQARNSRSADIRSDIYSLGCTLYALLAGRPPFVCPTAFETIAMHMSQPPEPLSKHNPLVPARLDQVIQRALAKEPADRYATPLEFANALQPWAKGIGMLPSDESAARGRPAGSATGLRRPSAQYQPPPLVLGDLSALFKTMLVTAILGLAGFFVLEYWPKITEVYESISHKKIKADPPDVPLAPPAGPKGSLRNPNPLE
jgi:serine/threonine protein kinase